MKALLIFAIPVIFASSAYAQNRWSVGVKSGIGVQFYDREATSLETLPDTFWGPYKQPFYNSYSHYRIGLSVDYEATAFLKPGITFYFSQRLSDKGNAMGTATLGQPGGGSVSISRNSSFQVTEWGVIPGVSFDGLFRNNNEALHLLLAVNLGIRSQHHNYRENVDTTSMIYQEFVTTRTGFFAAGLLGLEWEEYFTPHWGYSISAQYHLPIKFTPKRLNIESYILNYEEKPTDEGEYSYNKNQQEARNGRSLKQETFFSQSTFINLSIRYRF